MEASNARAGSEDPALKLLAEHEKFWRRLVSVPRVLDLACGTRVGTTPHEVVYQQQSLKLLRFVRKTPATYAEPLLLCYALINRHYILDLQPERSVVARYLDQGFDVYLIDWGVPGDGDRGLTLEDYVCRLLGGVVEFVLARHRRDDLHVLGYCMGGTLAALYGALHPARTRTLTLLAAPIDFGGRSSLLELWTDRRRFDVDAFVDAYGNCPAWLLQSCFQAMRPVQNILGKGLSFYDQLDGKPEAISHYFAMERWINDNIPIAGETFRQFVKHLYQEDQLVKGQLRLGDARVDLGRITCPLLLLTARNDHLVEPASTTEIRTHVGSQDVRSITLDAGHVGLVVGGKAHQTVWPEATRWLADRSRSVGGESY